jgi:predicted kinase
MDLERLGAPELGAAFLGWYTEFSGCARVPSLEHHHVAYRGFVRAKVACPRHAQGDRDAADVARQLLALTARHLAAGRVRLVLVGGLPGHRQVHGGGRARRPPRRRAAAHRRVARRADPTGDLPRHTGYGRGAYTPAARASVYRELLDRARHLLDHGETVILDASWSSAWDRVAAREVARATSSVPVELRCVVDPAVAADRLRRRRGDASDADAGVAARMAGDFDAWPKAVDVATDRAPADVLDVALATVASARPPGPPDKGPAGSGRVALPGPTGTVVG